MVQTSSLQTFPLIIISREGVCFLINIIVKEFFGLMFRKHHRGHMEGLKSEYYCLSICFFILQVEQAARSSPFIGFRILCRSLTSRNMIKIFRILEVTDFGLYADLQAKTNLRIFIYSSIITLLAYPKHKKVRSFGSLIESEVAFFSIFTEAFILFITPTWVSYHAGHSLINPYLI